MNETIFNLKTDTLLLIESPTEIIIGNVVTADKKRQTIELKDARDIKNNVEFKTNQIIDIAPVTKIKLINDGNSHHEDEEKRDIDIECALTSSDLLLIEKQIEALVYIRQADRHYHDALADIRSQATISLIIEPYKSGRHARASVMVIATLNGVYIFDMYALGEIFKDLKLLLESKERCIVLHDSCAVSDQLKHRFNVNFSMIFDTYVAHCLLTGDKQPITLLQLLEHTFDLGSMHFEYEGKEIDSNELTQRPLLQRCRYILAKLAILLLKLHTHQLNKQILREFYRQCFAYSKTFVNNNDSVQVAMAMHSNSNVGQIHIDPTKNWRPQSDS